jgi:hypothetical protein
MVRDREKRISMLRDFYFCALTSDFEGISALQRPLWTHPFHQLTASKVNIGQSQSGERTASVLHQAAIVGSLFLSDSPVSISSRKVPGPVEP